MKILRLLLIFCLLANPCFGAVNFDGSDDVLTFGVDDSFMTENGPLTVCAWINPRSAGGGNLGAIVSRANPGEVRFKTDNNGLGRTIGLTISGGGVVNRQSASNSIDFNKWQHVCATWTGSSTASSIRLFINGVETSAYQSPLNGSSITDNSTAPLRIGANSGTTRTFDGSISEVAIWNSILTDAQIKLLASGVRRVPLTINPLPKRYIPLDDFGDRQAIPTTSGLIKNRVVGVFDNGTQSGGATGRGDFISYP